jgi:hypothetical protein
LTKSYHPKKFTNRQHCKVEKVKIPEYKGLTEEGSIPGEATNKHKRPLREAKAFIFAPGREKLVSQRPRPKINPTAEAVGLLYFQHEVQSGTALANPGGEGGPGQK